VDTEAGCGERSLEEVLERVSAAQAPDHVIKMAERIFRRIEAAEVRVHGPSSHFHEVGADDAIAEVLGACVALDSLQVDTVQILPLALGKGTMRTGHGILPVPAPATVEILRDSALEIYPGGGEGELCTPTGAAILAEFHHPSTPHHRQARIRGVGYGAGTREDSETPNVLRTILLESDSSPAHDVVDILETNVDDVTGEVLAYTMDRLLGAGARDASAAPLVMKKGRPAYLLRVICDPSCTTTLAAIMAEELGTLGIRCLPSIHRIVAQRSIVPVAVMIQGEVRRIDIKCRWKEGSLLSLKPEYEQCRTWAESLDLPLKDVLRKVEDTAWKQIPPGGD
jgi:uncharacterized protein (TIGR00299 family) protein